MRAEAGDTASLDEEHVVGQRDRRRTRRDRDDGAGQHAREPGEDAGFGRGVDARGGVVEHQQLGLTRERAGQGDALALPAGQRHSPLSDHCRPAVRQVVDELVHLRDRRRSRDRVVVEAGAEIDVVEHRPGEEERLLEHQRDRAANLSVGKRVERDAAEGDRPLVGQDQTVEHRHERALSRARCADDRDDPTGRDRHVEVVEHVARVLVAERDVVEAHCERTGRQRRHGCARDTEVAGPIDLTGQHAAHSVVTGHRPRQVAEHEPDEPQRPHHEPEQRDEADDLAGGRRALRHPPRAEGDEEDGGERRQRVEHRVEPGPQHRDVDVRVAQPLGLDREARGL